MKYKLATTAGVVTVALVASTLSISGFARKPADAATTPPSGSWNLKAYGPRAGDDVILKWDEQMLNTIRAYPAQTGPTITSRALGVLHTATYDAWAAYDPVAKVTRPDGPTQQPKTSNTIANKSKAISFAAYQTLLDLFPDATYPAKPPHTSPSVLMASLGYDPADTSAPAMVGKKAATAVLNYRHADGSNQLNGYADTTGYTPVNQWNNVVDKWHWQPLCTLTGAGAAAGKPPKPADGNCVGPNYAIQKATTPQWARTTPFAAPVAQYKVTGPRKNQDGSNSTADIVRAYEDTSNLDDVKKSTAEYWADGPNTEFPPGHTALFAQALSRRNGYSLDQNVKLFFALGNAEMDAGLAAWVQKFKYDYVRPITGIREYYKGQMITSWLGPNKGYGLVPAEDWMPYQQLNVVTPPFPEYVSGHSTFTASGNVVLTSYFGDTFGAYVTIPAGSSKFEANTPATDVTLYWPTFTAAADDAGLSRRYGGIHFYSGDYDGRMLGNLTGRAVLGRANAYIAGTIGS